MMRGTSVLLPLLCFAVAAGCESAFSISSDGIIHVLITTSGSGSDSDGFTLTVDGGDARFVASGGRVPNFHHAFPPSIWISVHPGPTFRATSVNSVSPW